MAEFNYMSSLIRHEKYRNGLCKFRRRPETGCVVECDLLQPCHKCGWNPAVEEERKKKIREDRKELLKPAPKKWLIGRGEFPR